MRLVQAWGPIRPTIWTAPQIAINTSSTSRDSYKAAKIVGNPYNTENSFALIEIK